MPEAPREVDHTIPAVERVEHHRKAAKELLRATRAGQLDAVSRLREALGDVPDELRLADAQRAIAREHGHRSWAGFRRELERQAGDPVRSVARLGPIDPVRLEQGAACLLWMLASCDRRALERLREHVPQLAGLGDAQLRQRASIADARLVIAREYGFPTWRKLMAGLQDEAVAWRKSRQYSEPVAAALEAIRAGDAGSLRHLMVVRPELARVEVGGGRIPARRNRATRCVWDLARARARCRSGMRGCVDRVGQRSRRSTQPWRPASTGSSLSRCWPPARASTPRASGASHRSRARSTTLREQPQTCSQRWRSYPTRHGSRPPWGASTDSNASSTDMGICSPGLPAPPKPG